jgi:hypothetical protein
MSHPVELQRERGSRECSWWIREGMSHAVLYCLWCPGSDARQDCVEVFTELSSFGTAFRKLFEGSLLGDVYYLDCLRDSRHAHIAGTCVARQPQQLISQPTAPRNRFISHSPLSNRTGRVT